MPTPDFAAFTTYVEEELLETFDLTELEVDGDGDWQFPYESGPVWVRVVPEPDFHVYVFCRIAEGVAPEAWPEINRLNSTLTAGALVLTGDATIIAMMRLHHTMTNRESLRIIIQAMSVYMRDLGPMFEIVHGGGEPLPE